MITQEQYDALSTVNEALDEAIACWPEDYKTTDKEAVRNINTRVLAALEEFDEKEEEEDSSP